MPQVRCPICNQLFESEKAQSLPFCSERCRQIDLSRWLDEKYALPTEHPGDRDPDELPRDKP
jgi:uncharacterized protein